MKIKKSKLLYMTDKAVTKDWFAVRATTGGNKLNFWHDTGEHIYFYTFNQNDRFNQNVMWNEKICHELQEELRKASRETQPNIEVTRFAIDEKYFVLSSDSVNGKVPTMPKKLESWDAQLLKLETKMRRAAIEEQKGSEPAPFVVFGKHKNRDKEFAWKLTPDKEKRQGIVPGDEVVAWTRYGFQNITVTRIVKAEDVEIEPMCRIKKKAEKTS